jgi:hypothetical protein
MATRAEMEAALRREAAARGLDPDRWVKIVTGESNWNPAARAYTPKEDSRGLFQLNTKGGLGAEALRRGVSLAPEAWEAQMRFALDHAKKHGDRAWTVARQLSGERTPGIPINAVARGVTPRSRPQTVAQQAAAQQTPVTQYPDSPLLIDQGVLASENPWQKLADERKEQQQQAQIQQLQAQASAPPEPAPQPVPQPAAPPIDFAALMLPRIRRGLLSDDNPYSLGLLGVP